MELAYKTIVRSAKNILVLSLCQRSFSVSVTCAVHRQNKKRALGINKNMSRPNKKFTNEDTENVGVFEEFINCSGNVGHGRLLEEKTKHLIQRHVVQEKTKIKKKIIEKKYFKKPLETNLLTWKAKEQIRYLHCEFPDEWTPEELAKSFPISVDAVHRILKSSHRLRTEVEIAEHDKRVAKHWQQLKKVLKLKKGPPAQDKESCNFQHVLESGKLPLMINATGTLSLPMPTQMTHERQQQVGIFESIIAGSKLVHRLEEERISVRIGQEKAVEKLLKDIAESGDAVT